MSVASTSAVAQTAGDAPAAAPVVVVLRAAHMFDGTGAGLITNAVVVVTDDKITAAGPASSVTVPAGARVVDLGQATLLPGFIDVHTHIIGRDLADPGSDMAVVKDYPSYGAIVGVENALATVRTGDMVIVDGLRGEVTVHPTEAMITDARERSARDSLPRSRRGRGQAARS